MKVIYHLLKISIFTFAWLFSTTKITKAQVTPDDTVNTIVNQSENVSEITGGTTRGSNLFHSFQEFSVPTGNEAAFNNLDTIENIFSRVTGGNISNINGLISANGSASLFLINPAGIIFGEGASLDIGGSFMGSSADSILFPDRVEFSASDIQAEPILTVNAPIGLGFRENPGDIVNRANSFDDGGTPENILDDSTLGLEIDGSNTIALIGGNVLLEAGFVTANSGGRIEVSSVADNSSVSFTEVAKGWDISYENVTNFQDVNLTAFSQIGNSGEKNGDITGDVQIQGRNINVTEGSQIGIFSTVGQAGNVSLLASESITIDGNGLEVDSNDLSSNVFNVISNEASGENSRITIETPQLSLTNSGVVSAFNIDSNAPGVNIFITAANISLDGIINFNADFELATGIFAPTTSDGMGDGGTITIETSKLTINNGAQINTETFGAGNAGDLLINASELVELVGTSTNQGNPSGLLVAAQQIADATGNGGNITVNTPRLIVKDGAQIGSITQSQGNGGNIFINASESILLSGTTSTAELDRGRTGINVNALQFFDRESGVSIPTTGNAGNLSIETSNLRIEAGALITASSFSLGDGGDIDIIIDDLFIGDGGAITAGSFLGNNSINTERGQGGNVNITAQDSVEITGTRNINGEPVISSISTIAEGTGDAGSLTLTTGDLAIRSGGRIDASATGNEAAGNIIIGATTADLEQGSIRSITTAGEGGNITFSIADNLILRNESQISAEALGNANGGNIELNADFIIGFSSQPNGNDIIARAEQGTGGNINITAESLFGIEQGETVKGNTTNDIDAGSQFGLDGNVTISVLDSELIQGTIELPQNLIAEQQTITQACHNSLSSRENTLTVKGKGGIAPQPVEPLNSDVITIGGNDNQRVEQHQSSQVESFLTGEGKIIPAQSVVVEENGQVTLSPHSVNRIVTKNSVGFPNCV